MKSNTTTSAIALATALLCAVPCRAEGPAPKTMIAISPIFGQLVRFSMPIGFTVVFENTNGSSYIREAVPQGETTDKWTQMITVTGYKAIASKPNFTPQGFAGSIAGGFKGACPESFAAKGFGAIQLGDQQAYAAVAGCGKVNASTDGHNETALLVVVKGAADGYTIQWAERSASHPSGAVIDDAKWQARLRALMPIRFCAIIAGEAPPYPSCVEQK